VKNLNVDTKAEKEAVQTVAKIMTASIRTAPKGRGRDRISFKVLIDEEIEKVAQVMEKKAEKKVKLSGIFKRDANNIRNAHSVIIVGVKGTLPKSIDCGACGFKDCNEFSAAKKTKGEDFIGPICIFEALDLGIALGSAVKLASEFGVDNRIMYTIGSAAKEIEMIDADVILGIPLSATSKNIFFDRK
jgi:uncharacterized ferredoxin-like protein